MSYNKEGQPSLFFYIDILKFNSYEEYYKGV